RTTTLQSAATDKLAVVEGENFSANPTTGGVQWVANTPGTTGYVGGQWHHVVFTRAKGGRHAEAVRRRRPEGDRHQRQHGDPERPEHDQHRAAGQPDQLLRRHDRRGRPVQHGAERGDGHGPLQRGAVSAGAPRSRPDNGRKYDRPMEGKAVHAAYWVTN